MNAKISVFYVFLLPLLGFSFLFKKIEILQVFIVFRLRSLFIVFNMIKQGKDYDPNGEYIKTWVPELLSVSDDRIHTPWLYLNKPANYPEPILIAPEWERYYPKGSKKSVPDAKRQKKGLDFYFKSGAAPK